MLSGKWRAKAKRLVSAKSLPGWLVLAAERIYQGVNALSNGDWVRQHMNFAVVWAFIWEWRSAESWVFGIGWLTYLVLRPESEKLVVEALPSAASQSQPKMTIYTHSSAAVSGRLLARQIESLFGRSGWAVTSAYTDIAKHAHGVWVHGGTEVERAFALLALSTLRIAPDVDIENDNPPTLQIIIGRVETEQAAEVKAEPLPVPRKTPQEPQPRTPIPADEFEIEGIARGSSLYIKLSNPKADPKKGFSLWLVRVDWYSEQLEKGRGGFLPWHEIKSQLPSQLKPSRGSLIHGTPHEIELVRGNAGVIITNSGVLKMRDTRHRLFVELRWNDFVGEFWAEVVVQRKGENLRIVKYLTPNALGVSPSEGPNPDLP